MLGFLIHFIGERCIDLVFSGMQRCFVVPNYKKVQLRSLVGKNVKCIWQLDVCNNWIRYDNCKVDIFLEYNGDIGVIYSDNNKGIAILMKSYVWVSDDISDIPPWGMV